MEGDIAGGEFPTLPAGISIHALRVEGDPFLLRAQSCPRHFYPRPPGGGRPDLLDKYNVLTSISIHALRVEGDVSSISVSLSPSKFLSTPSGWRATYNRLNERQKACISIHALRVEGDFRDLENVQGLY